MPPDHAAPRIPRPDSPASGTAGAPRAPGLVREPIYHQLNELLRGLLRDGEFRPGDQFLTEREVATRFGISRVTANKALASLVTGGVLEFRKGVGTFVREGGLDLDLRRLVSFTAKAAAAGRQPTTRVLSFRRLTSDGIPAAVAKALALPAGGAVFHFERLRLAGGIPVILERRHVAAHACPGLTARQVRDSLYTLFTDHFGLRITGASQTIHAVNLTPADARLLDVAAGAAALLIHARGMTDTGPLWIEDTWYRGDVYEFSNVLGEGRPPRPARPVMTLTHPPTPSPRPSPRRKASAPSTAKAPKAS